MTHDATPSKEALIEQAGALADRMIAAYGRDFAMGALILAARFIAQGQDRSEALVSADGEPLK